MQEDWRSGPNLVLECSEMLTNFQMQTIASIQASIGLHGTFLGRTVLVCERMPRRIFGHLKPPCDSQAIQSNQRQCGIVAAQHAQFSPSTNKLGAT